MRNITVHIGNCLLQVENDKVKIRVFSTYGQNLDTELTDDVKDAFIVFGVLLNASE